MIDDPSVTKNGFRATFQTIFHSDCPNTTANLVFNADNYATAYLNNRVIGTGAWPASKTFKVSLQCG